MPDYELKKFKLHFYFFDRENNGFITAENLKLGLAELGYSYNDEEIEKIFKGIKMDDNFEHITYTEFLCASLDKNLHIKKNRFKHVF